jgi:hypothetical protein
VHALLGVRRAEIILQFHHIARKAIFAADQSPPQRLRGPSVRARRAAKAEIDAARKYSVKR